jgi:hypothetical protein
MAASFNSPWDIAAQRSIVGSTDASEYQPVSVVQPAIGFKPADGSQSRPNSPSHLDRMYAMCESFRADLANLVSAVASAVASFFGCSSRPAQDANVGALKVNSQRRVERSDLEITFDSQSQKADPKVAAPKRVTYTSLEEYQNAIAKYEETPKPDPLGTLIEKTVKSPTLQACIEEMQTRYQQLGHRRKMIEELLKMKRDPEQTGGWSDNWKDFLTKDLSDCNERICSLEGEIDILIKFVYSTPTSTPLAQFKEDLSTLYAQTPLEGLEKELSKLRNGYAETVEKLKGLKNPTGLSELLISKYKIEEKKLKLQEHLHKKADAELEKANAEPKSEAAAIEKSTFNTDTIRQAVCGGLKGLPAIGGLFVSDPSSPASKEEKVSLMPSFPAAAHWAASWTTQKPVGDSRAQKPKPLILAEDIGVEV